MATETSHAWSQVQVFTFFYPTIHLFTAQTDFELDPIRAWCTFQPETANQSQCINITIKSDEVLEGDESFFVVLDSSEPRIILSPNTSVVTILDSNSKLILY